MSHSSLSIEKTIFSHAFVFAFVSELDATKTFPNGLVSILSPIKSVYKQTVYLPLAVINFIFSNISFEVEPNKVFSSSFVVKLIVKLFISQ